MPVDFGITPGLAWAVWCSACQSGFSFLSVNMELLGLLDYT